MVFFSLKGVFTLPQLRGGWSHFQKHAPFQTNYQDFQKTWTTQGLPSGRSLRLRIEFSRSYCYHNLAVDRLVKIFSGKSQQVIWEQNRHTMKTAHTASIAAGTSWSCWLWGRHPHRDFSKTREKALRCQAAKPGAMCPNPLPPQSTIWCLPPWPAKQCQAAKS